METSRIIIIPVLICSLLAITAVVLGSQKNKMTVQEPIGTSTEIQKEEDNESLKTEETDDSAATAETMPSVLVELIKGQEFALEEM